MLSIDTEEENKKKLPRWQPKSRRGQFIGFSKQHAKHYRVDSKFEDWINLATIECCI
jgi:hypothetical protein